MKVTMLPAACCDCGIEIPRHRSRPRCEDCVDQREVTATVSRRIPIRVRPYRAEIEAGVDHCLDCGVLLMGGDSPWCICCAGVRYCNEQRLPEVHAWRGQDDDRKRKAAMRRRDYVRVLLALARKGASA